MTNSINPKKRKIIHRRKPTGISARISSSKYVAQQRTKARNIISTIQEKNIKLIAIDFDKTFLSIHTNGCYRGSVDNLMEYIRSTFDYLVQEILDSPAFDRTLHLCIVSFSSQEQLIRKLLQAAFRTPKTDQILIQGSTQEFLRHLNGKDFLGKEYHLSSIVSQLTQQRNITIEPDQILLLDDDVRNISIAEKFNHHVLEIRDGINLDILKEFATNL